MLFRSRCTEIFISAQSLETQLINDTYNSDINSLDIALDFQQSRRAEKDLKTTVILSDILQSGMLPKSLYRKVAELFRRKKVDRIIGIGRDMKEYGSAFEMRESEFYLTTDEFIHSPSMKTFRDELILLKGSRAFHFERITELLEKKVQGRLSWVASPRSRQIGRAHV